MRILGTATNWLFMLCLPLLLLTTSIGWAANSTWLYERGFEKYNVSQTTGLTKVELEKAASGLISYFNSDEETISLIVSKDSQPFVLFSEREVAHLRDVKGLIRLDYQVLLGTGIFVLVFAGLNLLWKRKKYWRRLAKGVVGGSAITLALMLLLGLATLLGFDQLFWQFHLISFTNDLWLLDPTKDYLIMLFPQGFWYDATLFCVLAAVAMAIISGGLAGVYLKKTKGQTP